MGKPTDKINIAAPKKIDNISIIAIVFFANIGINSKYANYLREYDAEPANRTLL